MSHVAIAKTKVLPITEVEFNCDAVSIEMHLVNSTANSKVTTYVVTYSFVDDEYESENSNAIRAVETTEANVAFQTYDMLSKLISLLPRKQMIEYVASLLSSDVE